MKDLKGFIFDMDGVVVDNHLYHFRAWMELASKYSFPLNADIYRDKYNGKTNRDLFKMIFGEISDPEILRLSTEKEHRYQEIYQDSIKPHDGLLNFLERLHQRGFKVALGTSAPTINVDFTLDKLNLRPFFHGIVDGPQVKEGKPHPEVYLKCLELLHLQGKDAVVFEDSLSGLEAGIRAGCHVVGVATSHKEDELRPKTKTIIKDFNSANELFGF